MTTVVPPPPPPVTVTFAVCCPVPPAPVQLSVNAVFALSAALVSVPDVAFAPLHPPDAVQVVAFVLDHVSIVVPPLATVVGLAVRVTVTVPGTGGVGLLP